MKLVTRKYIFNSIILSVLLTIPILLLAQETTQVILKKVAHCYQSAVPFKIGFTVRLAMPDNANLSKYSGIFFLGSDNQFRVSQTEEEIVYDGQWLWTYDKINRQVIVEEFNPRSSLKLIWDILSGSFDGYQISKSECQNGLLAVVELKPSSKDGYIRSLQMKIDRERGRVVSAEYRDFQDNLVNIELDTLIALGRSDTGLFKINLNEGDELIDLRP